MPADTTIRFRYLVEGSEFSDDPGADRWEANGYGQTHSVLDRYLQACGEAPRFDARRAPAAADIAVGPVLNRDRQVA